METSIGDLKSPIIELVKKNPTWKGNKLCKQTCDLWTCNLVYYLIKEVKRNVHETLFIIPPIRL